MIEVHLELFLFNILSQFDIWNWKYPFLPLKWIGMNAMLVYVMAAEGIFAGFINGWYYDDPHNTLVLHFAFCYIYPSHAFFFSLLLVHHKSRTHCYKNCCALSNPFFMISHGLSPYQVNLAPICFNRSKFFGSCPQSQEDYSWA